jgi:protein-S-isoprenylcysteine O-methyltransferase Ste14
MTFLEVKIPPPLVLLVSAAAMWLLARALPQLTWVLPGSLVLGILLGLAGIALAAAAMRAFRRHKTTVNPLQPDEATSVVTQGPFKITRNPMYLGLTIVLLGWAAYLSNVAAVGVIPLFMIYLTRWQIIPEERILLAKFGEPFALYMARVRRWL